jgi:protein-disulfide isomerase
MKTKLAFAVMAMFLLAAAKVEDGKLIDPTAAVNGPANAKVTLVVFSDFQCPACARMSDNLETFRKAHEKDVRVVFMDFPLSFHVFSMTAHEAAAEALVQGKFWELEQWIFKNQGTLFAQSRDEAKRDLSLAAVRDALIKAAGDLGMDKTKLRAALDDHRHQAAVQKRKEMGQKLGVNGTPTVFVNGVEVDSDWSEIEKAALEALK